MPPRSTPPPVCLLCHMLAHRSTCCPSVGTPCQVSPPHLTVEETEPQEKGRCFPRPLALCDCGSKLQSFASQCTFDRTVKLHVWLQWQRKDSHREQEKRTSVQVSVLIACKRCRWLEGPWALPRGQQEENCVHPTVPRSQLLRPASPPGPQVTPGRRLRPPNVSSSAMCQSKERMRGRTWVPQVCGQVDARKHAASPWRAFGDENKTVE